MRQSSPERNSSFHSGTDYADCAGDKAQRMRSCSGSTSLVTNVSADRTDFPGQRKKVIGRPIRRDAVRATLVSTWRQLVAHW